MSPTTLPTPVPRPNEVNAIAAIRDSVTRNLQITDCYSRLSEAMALRTGDCANWCTFATWASRQAGATIRGEDLLDRLTANTAVGATLRRPVNWVWRRLLRRGLLNPETRLGRLVREIHSPFDALERASDAVARGNRKVFEEIGYEFARYLHACPASCTIDSPEFVSFLEGLRPGPPPEGQELLRRAFTRYQLQAHENAPGARAQLTYLANLEIGLHEQTRLQPEIQEALEAIPHTKEDLSERAWRLLAPGLLLLEPLARLLSPLLTSYRTAVRGIVRAVITESMMVLEVPGGRVLHLGRHLDGTHSEVLSNLDLPDLVHLLGEYEPHEGACTDCGARDWADLRQRMHFILNFFRSFHDYRVAGR